MQTSPGWSTYLRTFVSSSAYIDLLAKPWWQTLSYFALVVIGVGIGNAAYIQQRIMPNLQRNFESSLVQLEQSYPTDLRITWTGQKLTMEPHQQYHLDYPPELILPRAFPRAFPRRLATYSPEPDFSADSLLMFTPTTLYLNNLSTWDAINLNLIFFEPFTITQSAMPTIIAQVRSYFALQLLVISTLVWIGAPLITLAWQLVQSLILSLLVYGFIRLYGKKLTWIQAWQMTLLICVTAASIELTTRWLYPGHQLPMFSLSFWLIFTYIALVQWGRNSTIISQG